MCVGGVLRKTTVLREVWTTACILQGLDHSTAVVGGGGWGLWKTTVLQGGLDYSMHPEGVWITVLQ